MMGVDAENVRNDRVYFCQFMQTQNENRRIPCSASASK